jgi:hypothetical protein
MGPSNETEAEALERRKVEALEAIAKALVKFTGVLGNDNTVIDVRIFEQD